MVQLLMQKIRNRKWLMLCLLTGNMLLISVLCCITMYSDAIQTRILQRRMDSSMQENGEYPLKLTMSSILTVITQTRHSGAQFETMQGMAENFESSTGVPVKELVSNYSVSSKAESDILRNGKKLSLGIQVGFLSNLEEHCKLVDGEIYSATPGADGIYTAIVSEKFMAAQKLVLGEVLTMEKLTDAAGNPLRIRIAGVFSSKEKDDIYWVKKTTEYDSVLFIPEETFRELFVNFSAPEYAMRGNWYLLFDYENLEREQIESLLAKTAEYKSVVEQETAYTIGENYTEELDRFLLEDNQTGETLWILQAPILVLLLAFIMMVSKQTLVLEQSEIAVMKSRGAGRAQIVLLYFLQSLAIGVAALVPGILLGALLCQLLGSANAFLEFVGRSALKIDIFTIDIAKDCFLAVLVSTLVTVFPVIRYSDNSVVGQRQKRKKRRSGMPFWQKFGLDFVILFIGLYGWYTFRGQEEVLVEQVLKGESLNPLLYFSSSLFMVGAGLVITRLIHLLPMLFYYVGKRFMSPALYASFSRIMRSGTEQNFIIVFLILTISLGIFNADTARTVNANDENNVMYIAGADVVLKEQWPDNSAIVSADKTGSITLKYQEPALERFAQIPGVESVTKVYRTEASVTYDKFSLDQISVMGIDTKEFGETAVLPDGLVEPHWYHYLNAMAANPYGVIVSTAFRDTIGYQLGDTVFYSIDGHQTRGIICGFVDYFPGFQPTVTVQYRGRETKQANFLIVANLAQLQSVIGIQPYEVWIDVTDTTEPVYQYIEEQGIKLNAFTDATQELIEHKNDALLQGTNGMLTVGFLIVLLLCVIGFMIFWVLSIKQRTLQFGVFRAMGMTMGEVVLMLVNEQLFISGCAAATGVAVGMISSRLFIPLIQIAYQKAEQVLPLQVISETQDTVQIILVVSAMIVCCIVALGIFISRTGIAQALKLGEDG